ncbi:DsbA family protein [Pannonibacter phragmitetus]|nr:DsbA family protein [Pannonibacter phragmitetus]
MLAASGARARAPDELPSQAEVFTDPVTPVLGNPDGDVTIVEFFDYQCPYCKSTYPALKLFVADDGNVRLMMRDWPIFGPSSQLAAQRVLSLDPEGYLKAHEALMATEGRLAESDVLDILDEAGVAALPSAHAAEAVSETLERNDRMANAFGLVGTPAFVIGSRVFGGVLDRNGLAQAVLEARGERE